MLLVTPRGKEPSPSTSTGKPVSRTGGTAPLWSGDRQDETARYRVWLARALRELREKTGLSASQVARDIGVSQSRLSRIETGHFLPSEGVITRLADLYRAPVTTRRRLLKALMDIRTREPRTRVVLRHGAWRMQREIEAIEENAAEICGFSVTTVPGLLQTEGYAGAVFADGGDIAPEDQQRAVAERLRRGQILEAGKRITLVMTEGALRWHAGSPQVMVGQLEQLSAYATGGKLRLGVIPWTKPVGAVAVHSFNMYDRELVIIGTRSATARITDPRDVATYSQLFDQLEGLASYGPEAARIIEEIAAGYRSLR